MGTAYTIQTLGGATDIVMAQAGHSAERAYYYSDYFSAGDNTTTTSKTRFAYRCFVPIVLYIEADDPTVPDKWVKFESTSGKRQEGCSQRFRQPR